MNNLQEHLDSQAKKLINEWVLDLNGSVCRKKRKRKKKKNCKQKLLILSQLHCKIAQMLSFQNHT